MADFSNIDYEKVKYVTNRKLKNKEKELTGEIKMFSYDGLNFYYKMKCPFCGTEQEGEKQFKRRPYYVECKNCGKKILIEKLNKK